jgi:quinol monooxygenase YgiN
MNKHGLIDVLTCAPEDQDKLFDLMVHIADHLETVDDCLYFVISKEAGNPTKIWVTELWTSKEAHDQSLENAGHIHGIIKEIMTLVTDERQRATLTPILGKGIARE